MYFHLLSQMLGAAAFLLPLNGPRRDDRAWSPSHHVVSMIPPQPDDTTRTGPPVEVVSSSFKEDGPEGMYVAHSAPKSTYLILNSPAISSFILVKGWREQSLQILTGTVHDMVKANPILTGRACCADNWWKDPTIRIQMGEFQPPQSSRANQNDDDDDGGYRHSFVTAIDKTNRLPVLPEDDNDSLKQLHYIDRFVAPLVGKIDSTLQQIQTNSPLFDVKVVVLPNGYACLYMKMSHCIGDFVTYYELLDQIVSLDKGEKIRPIHWDNPLKARHEIFPTDLTKQDVERLYGLPFLVGIASHVPTMPFQKKRYLLLSEEKIKRKKRELKELKGYHGLSANSIVTAALCDANRSTDIFALTKSMRGAVPGLGLRDGGNLHCEVPFQRCAGRNPMVIQDIVDRGTYFEPDEVPFWPSAIGKVGRISNCVVPMHHMTFGGGCKSLCYCPSKGFFNHVPLDAAVIFRVAKGKDAILHNFRSMTTSKLLNEILLDDQDHDTTQKE